MPREQITFDEKQDTSLHVNWHRDSAVQVSIEVERHVLMAWADQVKDDETITWHTPPLSRPEINRLIRVLRTARDQVHGRDE